MNEKSLEKIITEQTEVLRKAFIESTIHWSKIKVKENIEKLNYILNNKNKINKDPITHKQHAKFVALPKRYFDEELFIEYNVQNAINHYENCVKKLVNRLEKYQINKEKIKVVTVYLNNYIETTIDDGLNTYVAFATLVTGEIQRPHYRYYVKIV